VFLDKIDGATVTAAGIPACAIAVDARTPAAGLSEALRTYPDVEFVCAFILPGTKLAPGWLAALCVKDGRAHTPNGPDGRVEPCGLRRDGSWVGLTVEMSLALRAATYVLGPVDSSLCLDDALGRAGVLKVTHAG